MIGVAKGGWGGGGGGGGGAERAPWRIVERVAGMVSFFTMVEVAPQFSPGMDATQLASCLGAAVQSTAARMDQFTQPGSPTSRLPHSVLNLSSEIFVPLFPLFFPSPLAQQIASKLTHGDGICHLNTSFGRKSPDMPCSSR